MALKLEQIKKESKPLQAGTDQTSGDCPSQKRSRPWPIEEEKQQDILEMILYRDSSERKKRVLLSPANNDELGQEELLAEQIKIMADKTFQRFKIGLYDLEKK